MRVKPKKHGMWSCWHLSHCKTGGIIIRNQRLRYVWHYYKYHSWLISRRDRIRPGTPVINYGRPF